MNNSRKKCDKHIGVRVPAELRTKFQGRCELLGRDSSDLLREIILAFTEARLVIKLDQATTEKQKQKESLYEHRKQD